MPPVVQKNGQMVTADALPTLQIDGVVWTQVMIGNTVYAAGDFSTARPAGAAPDTSTTERKNLLAYSITTGKLSTTFKPAALNGQVKALAVSPDKTTLYVGGDFTLVGTAKRLRFAAFNASTGALRSTAPAFNGQVKAITVAGSSIYVGGLFTAVGTTSRSRLAALSVTTGKLTTWAPKAADGVNALVATPDKTKIVVGGKFAKINTTAALGMGAVDARTGVSRAWKVNTVVKDYGANSAILSLAVDADTVYGSGYAYGGGNFEGAFAANPTDGSIRWLQDCHGDTYGVAPIGNTVYTVGHAHYCENMGGFPDTSPRVRWQRALAVTKAARGTVAVNGQSGAHYGNFAGKPAPSLVNWFPQLSAGTYTGMNQGPWSVVGNATYVSAGGEFTTANGRRQQGLVRFAVPASAPNAQGPLYSDATVAPQLSQPVPAAVQVDWLTNVDRDDRTLTYEVLRDDVVVHSVRAVAYFWKRPLLTWTDTAVTEGVTYAYAVRATDPNGNQVTSPVTEVAVQGSGTPAGG